MSMFDNWINFILIGEPKMGSGDAWLVPALLILVSTTLHTIVVQALLVHQDSHRCGNCGVG